MANQFTEREYLLKISELSDTVEKLVEHNIELKSLILRSGDREIKGKLEKLMRKHGGSNLEQDVA